MTAAAKARIAAMQARHVEEWFRLQARAVDALADAPLGLALEVQNMLDEARGLSQRQTFQTLGALLGDDQELEGGRPDGNGHPAAESGWGSTHRG